MKGLVIGKFYPPHKGHDLLVSRAARECESLTVLVLSSSAESMDLSARVAALQETHAKEGVEVIGEVCEMPMDLFSESIWKAQVRLMQAVLRAHEVEVDALFSSELYGPELAERLGVEHHLVDLERGEVPVSGTEVRSDLSGRWEMLSPATQAQLATRVVILGAESTGTTTLSQDLLSHYRSRGGVWASTQWVGEYGREYTEVLLERCTREAKRRGEALPDVNSLVWGAEDFDEIACEQTAREERAARKGSPLLVCDTDALATRVWEKRYLGERREISYGLLSWLPPRAVYLLTDHESVAWEDDGLREGDLSIRREMTRWFEDELTAQHAPWMLLSGSRGQRLSDAVRVVDGLLERRAAFGRPLV